MFHDIVGAAEPGGELEGFPQAKAEFRRMIQGLKLRVDDDDTAESVAFFYVEVARGRSIVESIVTDELTLQSVAAADFRDRYSKKDEVSRFNQWRARTLRTLPKSLAIVVEHESTNFVVKYFRYDDERLVQESLVVHPDGTVDQTTSAN